MTSQKPGLHPRNRHRSRYDMKALCLSCPELQDFIVQTPAGEPSVNFADPLAVKTLNKALLAHFYGVTHWDIPDGFLCPPVPGRADYVHHLADLLADDNGGVVPKQATVLDIGTGANLIYPLWKNLKLQISGDAYFQSYRYENTSYNNIKRKDQIYTGAVGLTLDINRYLSLLVQYAGTRANSNIYAYDYDRSLYSAGCELRF